ncbi:UNVERIFIED_CONTAM: Defensin-like protein [Sesamum latifolium]|uniref:Defensin-like protein n=1 Tax=Sesamum latifolium TaxID=2727402 RepID=A0AAW2WNL0_9LAMI
MLRLQSAELLPALLLLHLLISQNGVEAAVCSAPSRLFHGVCILDSNCAKICEKEGYLSGNCKGLLMKCICIRDCGGESDPPEGPPDPPTIPSPCPPCVCRKPPCPPPTACPDPPFIIPPPTGSPHHPIFPIPIPIPPSGCPNSPVIPIPKPPTARHTPLIITIPSPPSGCPKPPRNP